MLYKDCKQEQDLYLEYRYLECIYLEYLHVECLNVKMKTKPKTNFFPKNENFSEKQKNSEKRF